MRLYHFVPKKFGLENLRRQRLKIATIFELNDPFDLLALDLSDVELRSNILKWKAELAKQFGLLCFSRSWRNPVQWSHYADKHQGLCLGFDLPDTKVHTVHYSSRRLVAESNQLLNAKSFDEDMMKKILATKFSHWRYEQEVRAFPRLENRDPKTKLYFSNFSDDLKLAEVIIGSESDISRNEILNAMGQNLQPMIIKARLAFKTFRVTTQKNDLLWK